MTAQPGLPVAGAACVSVVRLHVANLTKRYSLARDRWVDAVADLSFDVHASECFGLLGPNGAGKSTAIQCISGFYPATQGEVRIDGIDVHADPKRARRELGVCAQEDTLDTDFRVLDQLVRHATYFRVPVAQARERALSLLARFGIADKAQDLVESLSGGTRRRLQLARALIAEPRVLLLDEPTTGLDPAMRRVAWDVLMAERAKGAAILLCTHNMEEAERLCDRVGLLSQGRFVALDTPRALVARHIGEAKVEETVRQDVIWQRAPNLEDVYLKLTGAPLREVQAQP